MSKPISEQTYPFAQIEAKWQKIWEERGTYKWNPPLSPPQAGGKEGKPKFYVLTMFSYPSGDKLHIGHWYCYAPADTFARFKRMQGYEVFEPMGFDAFGLPAENYAIRTGIHPKISTEKNIAFMREQLKRIGAMYDWDYEVNTAQPDYYRWTQWWFLLMYQRGLAYQKEALVNWCPMCQTVLANEQVEADNTCERCGAVVARRRMKQWFFRITDYCQRLLDGLETIDWPEKTKAMQRYWIGKSEGTEIEFDVATPRPPVNGGGLDSSPPARRREDNAPPNPPAKAEGNAIRVFTTRADTLFGVTYLVLAPEHSLVSTLATPEHRRAVEEYVESALRVSEVDRTMADRPKTGVFTGSYAIHPFTECALPIWVADYVIGGYGTGAVMAVPAHDQRDFEFARQFGLPIEVVIQPPLSHTQAEGNLEAAFTEYGTMVNSGEFTGLTSEEGMRRVGERLKEMGRGRPKITWHLRDWTISRQRYWGAPIPIVHCPKCGTVPVAEDQLPVLLPEDIEDFRPRGKSPLAAAESFIRTTCPRCSGPAERDPDTMDTFVCSSWYYMRYPDARLDTAPFDTNHLNAMLPIEQYVGGSEHAMGHLIYARFFAKVAHDAGFLHCDEPFSRLVHQGIILNQGKRMSKTEGNVIAPEPIIDKYGSDVLRMFLMFSGDYSQGGDWTDKGIAGIERFVGRLWRLASAIGQAPMTDVPPVAPPQAGGNREDAEVERKRHQTIKAVTADLQDFHFNTAIARLMELTNAVYSWVGSELREVTRTSAKQLLAEDLVRMVAPFAPHLGEEMWHLLGHESSVFDETWPQHDAEKARAEKVSVAVQINGKLRDVVEVDIDSPDEVLKTAALSREKIAAYVAGKEVMKTIIVPNRIVNLVVR